MTPVLATPDLTVFTAYAATVIGDVLAFIWPFLIVALVLVPIGFIIQRVTK